MVNMVGSLSARFIGRSVLSVEEKALQRTGRPDFDFGSEIIITAAKIFTIFTTQLTSSMLIGERRENIYHPNNPAERSLRENA